MEEGEIPIYEMKIKNREVPRYKRFIALNIITGHARANKQGKHYTLRNFVMKFCKERRITHKRGEGCVLIRLDATV